MKLIIATDSFVVPETAIVQVLIGKRQSEFFVWIFILQLANQKRSLEYSFCLSSAISVCGLLQGLGFVPRKKTLNSCSPFSGHKNHSLIGPRPH